MKLTKSDALRFALTELENLRETKGMDYPRLRDALSRLSTDALVDFSNLIKHLNRDFPDGSC